MAKTNKIKLSKDYTNWWALAGDVYGGLGGLSKEAAQRYFNVLKAANRGTSLTAGNTIVIPDIDPSKPHYLSHETVARERGEYDYETGQPSQEYWDAVNQYKDAANQGLAAGETTTGVSTTAGAGPGMAPQAPEGFTLSDVKRSQKYGYDVQRQVAEQSRYVPQKPETYEGFQLPQEYYEYFYPKRAEHRERLLLHEERRRAAREEDRRPYGIGDVTRAPTVQQATRTPQQRADQLRRFREADMGAFRESGDMARQRRIEQGRRFNQGQYGAYFDPRPIDETIEDVTKPTFSEWLPAEIERRARDLADKLGINYEDAMQLIHGGEYPGKAREQGAVKGTGERPWDRRFHEGQYGAKFGVKRYDDQQMRSLFEDQVQSPYTTDWLNKWLDANDPDLADEATKYMLLVVGFDPVTGAGIGGGYGGGYGGGGGYYYGGGRGGSARRTSGGGGGGYAQAPTRRYPANVGLVSWRI